MNLKTNDRMNRDSISKLKEIATWHELKITEMVLLTALWIKVVLFFSAWSLPGIVE